MIKAYLRTDDEDDYSISHSARRGGNGSSELDE